MEEIKLYRLTTGEMIIGKEIGNEITEVCKIVPTQGQQGQPGIAIVPYYHPLSEDKDTVIYLKHSLTPGAKPIADIIDQYKKSISIIAQPNTSKIIT